jgi:anti-anti-sigma regulatory factor
MASNFGLAIDRNSDGFGLQLAGDFDGTSAYELIYAIKKLPEDTVKLYIYTNGLKTIHSFGLDVFHKFMRSLNGQSAKIVFTGTIASRLSPRNSRLISWPSFLDGSYMRAFLLRIGGQTAENI